MVYETGVDKNLIIIAVKEGNAINVLRYISLPRESGKIITKYKGKDYGENIQLTKGSSVSVGMRCDSVAPLRIEKYCP